MPAILVRAPDGERLTRWLGTLTTYRTSTFGGKKRQHLPDDTAGIHRGERLWFVCVLVLASLALLEMPPALAVRVRLVVPSEVPSRFIGVMERELGTG